MSLTSAKKNEATPQTLEEFMREKQRRDCKVCALPQDITAQLGKPASDRGFSRDDQVEWLAVVAPNAKVSRTDLDTHMNRRHAGTT